MTNIINTSNITADGGATFFSMTGAINEASGLFLFASIIFIIYLILLVAISDKGIKIALVSSSFIVTILSSYLWYLGWISSWIIAFPLGALILGIIFLYLFDD